MFVIKIDFFTLMAFEVCVCVCVCHYGSRETPETIHSFHIYIILYILW